MLLLTCMRGGYCAMCVTHGDPRVHKAWCWGSYLSTDTVLGHTVGSLNTQNLSKPRFGNL